MAIVTDHAAQRWSERVNPNCDARAAIMEFAPIIDRAAEFGCDTVITGTGHRLKLKGDVVLTVLPKKGW